MLPWPGNGDVIPGLVHQQSPLNGVESWQNWSWVHGRLEMMAVIKVVPVPGHSVGQLIDTDSSNGGAHGPQQPAIENHLG